MFGPQPWLPRAGAIKNSALSAVALALAISMAAPAHAAPTKSKTQVSSPQKKKAETVRKKTASGSVKRAKRGAGAKRAPAPAMRYASRVGDLMLESDAIMVMDQRTGMPLLEKNSGDARPIASITKLMTAMVVLDAGLPMNEQIQIVDADVDRVKFSTSRLAVGTTLSRQEMLHLALMASENRAAHSLARTYPGGMPAFLVAMNRKARSLGMTSAQFFDPTGLDARNVASPKDLARMVSAAADYSKIREFSTDGQMEVAIARHQQVFRNTNPLVQRDSWDIVVSKTGYIREAGRCLVMQAMIKGRETLIVLMDGQRRESRILDSVAVRQWLEKTDQRTTLKAADLMHNNTV